MAIARVQLADGRIARLEVPDGTTPEQAQAIAEQQFGSGQEPSVGQQLLGAAEVAATIGSGIIAEPLAGLAGIGAAITPGGATGGEAVEATREALTFQPRTQAGQQQLQAVGEFAQPATELLQAAETGLGEAGFELGGPVGGAIGAALPTAAAELLGVGLAKGAGAPLRATGQLVGDVAEDLFRFQTPTKQRIGQLLQEGTGDIETARFRLDAPPTPEGAPTLPSPEPKTRLGKALNIGGPKVVKDNLAIDAINQGFDEGVIAAVKGSSKADKQAFKEMVNIMQKGKKNARFALEHRPSDVVGDLLMDRLRVVVKANKDAGKRLGVVAKSLKGKEVEFQPAIDSFINDLDEMGVSIGRTPEGKVSVDFTGSDIEGLTGPESVVKRVVNRMSSPKAQDAFELHRMKKFIDEQVTFGKNAEGLAGKTEFILKTLRRNIDQSLDGAFPQYDKINTQFSETIGAIDAFQDVAGRKMNLTGPNAQKATGTLLRRLMSNAQSRITLLDSVNEIEQVAKKFGGKMDDTLRIEGKVDKSLKNDILSQVLFVDELDSVFGPVARTSFQGQIGQAIKQGAEAVRSPAGAAVEAFEAVSKRGINQQGAFDAIRKLLDEQ